MHPFTSWRPRAVIFDCDGLLADTEPCWTVAETELFARRGRTFGPAEKALIIGRSLPDGAALLADLFAEPDPVAIAEELLTLVGEAIAAGGSALPGAHAIVDLAARAVPVAVASNSPRALLDATLVRIGLEEAFTISIAADEVANAKPDPEMYLTACARLDVAPADALAFEDSLTGLRSALAAGLRTVGVPTLRGQEFGADIVVESLVDERLVRWVQNWQ